MPDLKNHPPMPSWHGTPPDLVDKYLAFKRSLMEVESLRRREKLRDDIESYETRKASRLRSITSLRATISDQRAHLDTLRSRLIDTSDLARFEESLIGLMYHPDVIGLRVASNGRLIIHVRVTKQEDDEDRFVGHFEIDLLFDGIDKSEDDLLVVQTDITSEHEWSRSYSWGHQEHGLIRGSINSYPRHFQPLLEKGELVELVDAAIGRLRSGYSKQRLGIEHAEPVPTWSGICPGIEYALGRTLEWSINRPLRGLIAQAENDLAANKAAAKDHSDRLRELNLHLTARRAELVALDAAIQEGTFDEEAAREELLYISTLPGVMGIRFETIDQRPIPVIHVRASLTRDGRRYDMGDYEFVLRRHSDSAAVIETRLTRRAKREVLYYHRATHYSMSWFCFGSRAYDLSDAFMRGEIGDFLHVAIDSLNSVNPGDLDYYYVEERFPRIDNDAVWNAPPPNRRPRRRGWVERLTQVTL